MADVKFIITADASVATSEVNKFDDALTKMGENTKPTASKITGLWKDIALGQFAFDAAKKAGMALWGELKDSIDIYLKAQEVQLKLNSALRDSGDDVEVVGDKIDRFANKMEFLTGTDDKQVKQLEILARQYGIQKDKIEDAIEGAIGLTEIGGDLEGNLKAVANAYEGNWMGLDRLIPEIKAASSETDKMAILQEKMAKGFNVATEKMSGYAGQLRVINEQWEDLKETAGQAAVEGVVGAANVLTGGMLAFRQAAQEAARAKDADERSAKNLAASYVSLKPKIFDVINATQDFVTVQKGSFNMTANAERQLKNATSATDKHASATTKAAKAKDKFTKEIEQSIPAARKFSTALMNIIPPLDEIADKEDEIGSKGKKNFAQMIESARGFTDKAFEYADKIASAFSTAYSFIDAAAQQSLRNREIAMENEYKKRLELINNSRMSEEEKAKAIEALDAEYDKKRSELERKKAEQQKKASYTQAVIAAFQASAQTYATFGFPWGIAPAALVFALAMGLANKIKAQPIPLAKGAIFKEPSMLTAQSGQQYQVAEGGEAEILSSPSKLREAIFGKGGKGGVGGGVTYTHITLNLDGKFLKEFIVKTINDQSKIGKVKMAGKAVA